MMSNALHMGMSELLAGLDEIRQSPKEEGVVALIVRRPRVDEREVLREGHLTEPHGLVGDIWSKGRSPNLEIQLTIMNSRAIELIAQKHDRWPLAGDQIYIDLDLSKENLPPETQLVLGTAIIQVTAEPHTGCRKFLERFGADAVKFVNSEAGRRLKLRGINAKIVRGGTVKVGDMVRKIDKPHAAI